MKKIHLLFIMALFTNLSLFSQNIVFEDANFKKALLRHNPRIDTNIDREISKEEAEKLKGKLNLRYKKLKSLKGLEYFINITNLDCKGNQLTNLYLPKNTALTHLDVSSNFLTKLDVSKNTALTHLKTYHNPLTNLDISKNTELTVLDVRTSSLTNLDVSENTALTHLNVSNNPFSNLDISKNSALTFLRIVNNKVTNLDISRNTALTHLDVSSNFLTKLDVSKNIALTTLNFGSNQLTNIDISKHTMLTHLNVWYNPLKNLNISKNTALTNLEISGSLLTNIDLSKNTALIKLSASSNHLTNLDLSKNIALTELWSLHNKFISLDLSNCKLKKLFLRSGYELKTLNLIGQQLDKRSYIKNNPKLELVCTNSDKLDYIESKLKGNNNGAYTLSTDCTPLNTITGKVSYAPNLGLCGTSNLKPFNQLRVLISSDDRSVKKVIIPDTSGNYSVLVPKGNYTVGIQLVKRKYFDYSPKPNNNPMLGFINFKRGGETKTKNICVTPKGTLDDLAVSIIGGKGKPGFSVTYTMLYKNIGNTILSGKVNFKILDPNKQVFIRATTDPSTITTDNLSWDFKDLAPMESKTIKITFLVNKPTDVPSLNAGDLLKYIASITDTNGVEKSKITLVDNTAPYTIEVKNSWDPNDKTCIEGRILRPKNVGKYLTYMIRFENKGNAEATHVRVEDLIDATKFDIKSLRYITSGDHLCVTEVEGNTVNFNFKNINLGFNPSDNKGYVLFKIKTLESLKEGDEIKNKASIYFDFNKPVITEIETVVVKKKVKKEIQFSDYYMLTPNPTKGLAELIEKKKGLKIKFFTINDSNGDMIAFDPGTTRKFDFWYLISNRMYYLRVFTENNGILSTKFIKE